MFTNQEALSLLDLPKHIREGKGVLPELSLKQEYPFQHDFNLTASDFLFRYEINQSGKNMFKLTLYLMEDETKIGLLRIDYRGQHKNPDVITENLPPVLHPYTGKWFGYDEPHIHYYVEGYRTSLDWAVPLSEDLFPVKSINAPLNVVDAFLAFNKRINLETRFNIDRILI